MTLRAAFASNTAWNLFNFRGAVISALLARGDEVITLAPPDSYSEKLAALGCEVVDLPMDNRGTNPLRDLRTLRDFRRAFREAKPDVALHYTIKPVVYGTLAARSLGVPVVNTITGLGTGFLHGGPLQAVVETLYRVSQRWPHRVFFQNPDNQALFVSRGLGSSAKAERLPGSGVDLERFQAAASAEKSVPVFLLIARLLLDKGVGEFIEASRALREDGLGARFQLLGPLGVANRTALTREQVDRWVGEGVVEYLGETGDVRPCIERADCVVLPSYSEGTPRTLLEAAAMGRPIVATNVPGCRETVDDGVNGFLCKVRDAVDLAAKMRLMAETTPARRREMGLAGRAKMEREFDQRIVVRRYLQAIDEAVAAA